MRKTKRFGFALTHLEKDAIAKLADLEGGLSQAAMLRRLLRKAAIENGLEISDVNENYVHLSEAYRSKNGEREHLPE